MCKFLCVTNIRNDSDDFLSSYSRIFVFQRFISFSSLTKGSQVYMKCNSQIKRHFAEVEMAPGKIKYKFIFTTITI